MGEPQRLAEQIGNYLDFGFFSVSANGVLAYRTRTQDSQLTWLDRQGKAIGRLGEPGLYTSLELSPEGTRAVFSRSDVHNALDSNLWLLDLERGTSRRFTSADGANDYPVWSSDGSRIVFASSRENGATSGLNLIYQKPVNGSNDEEVILRSPETTFPTSWSRDGRFLLLTAVDPKTSNDVWMLSMEGDHKRTRLIGTKFGEAQARFSPDSRWIAYTSDASGRNEVYIRAFPDATEDIIVSSGGGSPRWRPKGRELYYLAPDRKVMVVDVGVNAKLQPGKPQPLFQAPGVLSAWDVTPDGNRFLFAMPVEQGTSAPFTIVQNWTTAMERRQ
jgi:eukaryotic-like serine/threonine-protein kinase